MSGHFEIAESLRFGWDKLRAHSGILLQAMLVLFAVQVASSIVERVLGQDVQGVLASLALAFVSLVVGTGFTLIALKLAHGQHAHIRDIVPPGRIIWRYFLVSVLTGLIVIAGLILLIVPGVYVALRLSMAHYLVLEGAGVREALHTSARLTEGVKWHLLGFFLVLAAINILGAILLGVGLLVSVPVSAVAFAHVYLKLKNRSHAH